MAGSDKKQQKVASSESVSAGAAPFAVQDPDVSHFVMTGDPKGLIHRAKLDSDQTTTITTWANPIPDGDTEFFRLQIARAGSNEWTKLDEHSFTGGNTWVPLVFTIPSTFFLDTTNEGPFDLRYEHENAGLVKDWSNRVPIIIDKIAPHNGKPPKKMEFSIAFPIVDETFVPDPYIEGKIPLWDGELLNVSIFFGWIKGQLPEDPGEVEMIGPLSISPGGTVQITKAMVEKAGDGLCTAGYALMDKAGNLSPLSEYELMSVALGKWPVAPLGKPTIEDATGDEFLRSDIVNGGAMVNVPYVTNAKTTDTLVVALEDEKLIPGTPVGPNPSTGTNIFMPWEMIWKVYAAHNKQGVVDIELAYELFRGVEPIPSAIEIVKFNLSAPGPVSPLPNPEPGNDQLKPVNVLGESGVPNVLIASDEDEEVNAQIELVDPLVDGDTYTYYYNNTPMGTPYVIDISKDKEGDTIKIPLDWDDLRVHGPSDAMSSYYKLTNPLHGNHQEPDPHSTVEIKFLTLEMPEAEPQTDHPSGWITCNHLREKGGEWGFEWKIPANPHMKEGDDVNVEFNGYTDFFTPVLVPATNLKHTFTNITEAQARDGIIWWVGPYSKHFLPIWSKEKPNGKGEVTYDIEGKPAASRPTNTRIFLSQGEGSCNIPPNP